MINDLNQTLSELLDQTLNLKGRRLGLSPAAPLLGAVPELDSMGVVAMIGAMESHFDITISDQEIDGSVFSTLETLRQFIARKIGP